MEQFLGAYFKVVFEILFKMVLKPTGDADRFKT